MASEEVRGSFCRYDSCVITDQLATGAGALERELLINNSSTWPELFLPMLAYMLVVGDVSFAGWVSPIFPIPPPSETGPIHNLPYSRKKTTRYGTPCTGRFHEYSAF